VSLDCGDPAVLAEFYRRLLDGELLWSKPDSAGIRAGGLTLVAQRVPGHRAPTWPGESVVHLDLEAGPDLAASVERALALGATLVEPQTDERWRVLRDPAGHPFCITTDTPPPRAAHDRSPPPRPR
jgi:uncharacterized glyoxalase superfamily protein PhnB